ncbi:MAG: serine protease, partial [Proteobacteria bacterium]|nr:serine protease [Pseudomonadota bacterium]
MKTALIFSTLIIGLATAPASAQSRLAPYDAAAARMATQQPDRPGQRIVGGMQAIPGSYPFQVALVVADTPEGQEFAGFFCGGTRIGERHILTAAHCFQSKDGGDNVLASDVNVYLGQTNFRGGERIPVKSLTRHPQWNAISLANDIAVLELDRAPAPETRSTIIQMAPAATPESTAPRPTVGVRVIGWGALDQGGPSSRVLREVPLMLVDHGACLADHT